MPASPLLQRITAIGEKAGFGAVAFALYDYETALAFSHRGDRLFHAASTFKTAILLALYKAAEEGAIRLDDTIHVRNRFRSIADGSIYRVGGSRDGDSEVHQRLGRCMAAADLARAMTVRSSNLATNLLIDYLGLERIHAMLDAAQLTDSIRVVRGVEDELAFAKGLSNEVTAHGLVRLFRLLYQSDFFSEETRRQILDVLLAQEFNSMIPANLPAEVEVAHKTGEISTVCHDAGIVFMPERKPYVIAILTEAEGVVESRKKAVARMSETIYEFLTSEREAAK